MSMAVEQRPQSQLGAIGYDSMRYPQPPQFTNPWGSNQAPLFSQQLAPSSAGLDHHHHHQAPKGMPYSGSQQSAPNMQPTDIMAQRGFSSQFVSSAAQAPATYAPTSAPRYSPEYAQAYGYPEQDMTRRPSYQPPQVGRSSFSDALDASRGMVAMSQSEITPRNIYGGGSSSRHGSQDSYGFPSAQSSNSSISTGSSGYPSSYYQNSYSGSIDGSVTDYSSASEADIGHSRTLPAPGQLISGFPPEPSSMMGQFNSKVSPSAQKKHKCKICDKRFTRPSSLQTHMYSHTGEKPFACEVEGCGRHFSVVSNLRRHRKVHKEEGQAASPEEE